ncbi:hypothetical protein BACT_1249 [Bifidobacterium actinocoloniiforme DSM 22766]|uniref:Uncharacterized protein n=1 Tax=Bifidobacterium actinocoloniiforme DSM 22766 TaxID=1437605 RepID=A0A086Z1Z5_9BIFI|nr:hypothetical protein BACT_1249 [Bifidobacterium actinocoloniiforme DSM 22766]
MAGVHLIRSRLGSQENSPIGGGRPYPKSKSANRGGGGASWKALTGTEREGFRLWAPRSCARARYCARGGDEGRSSTEFGWIARVSCAQPQQHLQEHRQEGPPCLGERTPPPSPIAADGPDKQPPPSMFEDILSGLVQARISPPGAYAPQLIFDQPGSAMHDAISEETARATNSASPPPSSPPKPPRRSSRTSKNRPRARSAKTSCQRVLGCDGGRPGLLSGENKEPTCPTSSPQSRPRTARKRSRNSRRTNLAASASTRQAVQKREDAGIT